MAQVAEIVPDGRQGTLTYTVNTEAADDLGTI